MHIIFVNIKLLDKGINFVLLLIKIQKIMKTIAVLITMHFDNSKGNFEELRQKEMLHVTSWKESNILDSFFIKSDKDGAMIIFKDIEMEEVVKKIEVLPFFPFMEEVKYLNLDKVF